MMLLFAPTPTGAISPSVIADAAAARCDSAAAFPGAYHTRPAFESALHFQLVT